jgi:hypothetical protein
MLIAKMPYINVGNLMGCGYEYVTNKRRKAIAQHLISESDVDDYDCKYRPEKEVQTCYFIRLELDESDSSVKSFKVALLETINENPKQYFLHEELGRDFVFYPSQFPKFDEFVIEFQHFGYIASLQNKWSTPSTSIPLHVIESPDAWYRLPVGKLQRSKLKFQKTNLAIPLWPNVNTTPYNGTLSNSGTKSNDEKSNILPANEFNHLTSTQARNEAQVQIKIHKALENQVKQTMREAIQLQNNSTSLSDKDRTKG